MSHYQDSCSFLTWHCNLSSLRPLALRALCVQEATRPTELQPNFLPAHNTSQNLSPHPISSAPLLRLHHASSCQTYSLTLATHLPFHPITRTSFQTPIALPRK